jgi:hypothetical protein
LVFFGCWCGFEILKNAHGDDDRKSGCEDYTMRTQPLHHSSILLEMACTAAVGKGGEGGKLSRFSLLRKEANPSSVVEVISSTRPYSLT